MSVGSSNLGQNPPAAVNAEGRAPSKQGADSIARAEEKKLVALAQKGDPQAFRALFDAHHRKAYAVALGVVKRPEDAFDVVQEAFIKVHRYLPKFEGGSAFYTWLYRIVMNVSIDHLRKKQRQRTESYEEKIDRLEVNVVENAHMPGLRNAGPAETVKRKELSRQIQKALETLPEHHRIVIVLREVEGMSYAEMSETLEVPKGTIMSRLFHARRKMQEVLHGYVNEDGEDHVEE